MKPMNKSIRFCGHTSLRQSGFTLIELLVVISIISLLIAILLPALASARRSAQAIQCSVGMRTIGQYMAMYTADSKETYPMTKNQVGGSSLRWPSLLMAMGYTKHFAGVSVTPHHTYAPNAQAARIYCPVAHTNYSYAMGLGGGSPRGIGGNNWSGPVNNLLFTRVSEVLKPSNCVGLMESTTDFALGQWQISTPSLVAFDRHQEASNFWYADGHASRQPVGYVDSANFMSRISIK